MAANRFSLFEQDKLPGLELIDDIFTSTFPHEISIFCAPYSLLPDKQDKLAGLDDSNTQKRSDFQIFAKNPDSFSQIFCHFSKIFVKKLEIF